MRTLNSALTTLLTAAGSKNLVKADLITMSLTNGTVLNWTTGDTPLTINGTTFVKGPPITRGKANWQMGLTVNKIEIDVDDDSSVTVNTIPLVEAGWKNMFDLAVVTIQRFISDSWTDTAVGTVPWFVGIVGQIEIQGKSLKFTIESPLAQLKSTFPRTYIMTSCSNTFCDAVCTLLESNFTHAGTVGAGATANSFPLTLSGGNMADSTFQGGKVMFTSGANDGQVRTVKSYVGGVITLVYPLYAVPASGDGVNALEGCLKTQAACTGHNNIAHYRGYPFVPNPAVQYTGVGSGAPESTTGNAGSLTTRIGPRGRRGNIQQF